eukprot:scaffold155500_cov38-Prasinocladus_malaysianus.AAC.2
MSIWKTALICKSQTLRKRPVLGHIRDMHFMTLHFIETERIVCTVVVTDVVKRTTCIYSTAAIP